MRNARLLATLIRVARETRDSHDRKLEKHAAAVTEVRDEVRNLSEQVSALADATRAVLMSRTCACQSTTTGPVTPEKPEPRPKPKTPAKGM